MKEEPCGACGGQGWTAEHDIMDNHNPEDGSCMTCPVQVQCENCMATGIVETSNITRSEAKEGESQNVAGV